MFQGILPKRIASSDFTMVTTLVDPPATDPNKENQPGASKLRAPTGKGNIQSRKRADTKAKDHPPMIKEQPPSNVESMEVAFDRLLVRFSLFDGVQSSCMSVAGGTPNTIHSAPKAHWNGVDCQGSDAQVVADDGAGTATPTAATTRIAEHTSTYTALGRTSAHTQHRVPRFAPSFQGLS